MQALIERIRSVFLEMGFSEIEGDYVQSAGWNMDALYIPQSHPARTMQDTFYLSQPEEKEVEEEFLELWSKVHEHGHDHSLRHLPHRRSRGGYRRGGGVRIPRGLCERASRRHTLDNPLAEGGEDSDAQRS